MSGAGTSSTSTSKPGMGGGSMGGSGMGGSGGGGGGDGAGQGSRVPRVVLVGSEVSTFRSHIDGVSREYNGYMELNFTKLLETFPHVEGCDCAECKTRSVPRKGSLPAIKDIVVQAGLSLVLELQTVENGVWLEVYEANEDAHLVLHTIAPQYEGLNSTMATFTATHTATMYFQTATSGTFI